MITQIEGKVYLLQGKENAEQIIDLDLIPESEILLMLLDRVEYLMKYDPLGLEVEMFQNVANLLDCHFRRIRKKEING